MPLSPAPLKPALVVLMRGGVQSRSADQPSLRDGGYRIENLVDLASSYRRWCLGIGSILYRRRSRFASCFRGDVLSRCQGGSIWRWTFWGWGREGSLGSTQGGICMRAFACCSEGFLRICRGFEGVFGDG